MNVVLKPNIHNSILIVDDELVQLDSLKELMVLSGYQVETANCGNKAIEHLQNTIFDAVLLDLGLPDSEGLDTFAKVNAYTPDMRRTGQPVVAKP